jgi:apolipoprotein N-acyltransferase
LKRKLVLIFITGILLSLGWPTYGLPIVLFIALIPLLNFVQSTRISSSENKNKIVFGYSYLAFLIWNISTTWWIYNSSVFGAIFAILCNSSFYAILITFYHWSLKHLSKTLSAVFFIALWISFEKFHLFWDFSWPWLNLGNAFSENIYWIQWYEYTGVFGGTLWVLALNFFFLSCYQAHEKDRSLKKLIKKCVPGLLGIALPIVLSLVIYTNTEEPEAKTEIVLLQPNIDPYKKKYALENQDFKDLMFEISEKEISNETDYLLAPETYFASGSGFDLETFQNNPFNKSLENQIRKYSKLNLLTGAQFYRVYRTKNEPSPTANKIQELFWVDFYNSAVQIAPNKKTQIYHKSKLVVGVENMPYKSFFKPLLGEFMLDLGGTVSSRAIQEERSVFSHSIHGTQTAPIICYESIYGEFVTEYAKNGAQFFSILTNDAWWGNTQGHKQLLSYARLRAIENRRFIARSANTGISAFINMKGEIVNSLEYNKKGSLKGAVGLNNKLTFYTRFGDLIAQFSLYAFLLILMYALTKIFRKK